MKTKSDSKLKSSKDTASIKKNEKNPASALIILLSGFFMGAADLLPGISGSTVAIVLGVYDDFINLFNGIADAAKVLLKGIFKEKKFPIKKAFKEVDIKFGFFLWLGMTSSILLTANLLHYLLETERGFLFAFVLGLMLASSFIPLRNIKRLKLTHVGIMLASFAGLFLLLSLKPTGAIEQPSPILMFVSGVLGSTSMTLPGVSGSLILYLLGVYDFIVGAISEYSQLRFHWYSIFLMILVQIGAMIGLFTTARVVKWLMRVNEAIFMAFLTGLMFASLKVPVEEIMVQEFSTQSYVIAGVLAIFGAGLVLLSQKVSSKELKKV